jgi:hypothetical protein
VFGDGSFVIIEAIHDQFAITFRTNAINETHGMKSENEVVIASFAVK